MVLSGQISIYIHNQDGYLYTLTACFSFYVVLSGQISIYIHNQDRGDEEEKQELESIVQYKDGELDRSKLGNFVTSLGQ